MYKYIYISLYSEHTQKKNTPQNAGHAKKVYIGGSFVRRCLFKSSRLRSITPHFHSLKISILTEVSIAKMHNSSFAPILCVFLHFVSFFLLLLLLFYCFLYLYTGLAGEQKSRWSRTHGQSTQHHSCTSWLAHTHCGFTSNRRDKRPTDRTDRMGNCVTRAVAQNGLGGESDLSTHSPIRRCVVLLLLRILVCSERRLVAMSVF